jgi:hypothetical protein
VLAVLRRNPKLVVFAILSSYAFAWFGHFVIQKYRPATLEYPILSALGDIKMYFKIWQGTMDAEVARYAPVTPASKEEKTVLDELAKHPYKAQSISFLTSSREPVYITPSRFMHMLGSLLYNSDAVSRLPGIIGQASKHDYTERASGLLDGAQQDGIFISRGMYFSVICTENVAFYTDSLIQKYRQHTLFDSLNASQQEACSGWRSAQLDPADLAPVKSDRPVLILSSGFDPITPISFGEETHRRLSNSTLVVFPYQGHGVIIGSWCAESLVAAFFDAPQRSLDVSCSKADIKPIFEGAYQVQFTRYTDPAGRFRTQIPTGWTVDKTADQMTFFASPDANQLLGVGVFKNTPPGDAEKQAVALVTKSFGTIQQGLHSTQSEFFSVVSSDWHTLIVNKQIYRGLFLSYTRGTEAYVLWQAAPGNIFAAVLRLVLPLVASATTAADS